MDDEVRVFTVSRKFLAYAPSMVEPKPDIKGEHMAPFVPFIADVWIMVAITGKEKAKIHLIQFIAALSTDSDFRAAFLSV